MLGKLVEERTAGSDPKTRFAPLSLDPGSTKLFYFYFAIIHYTYIIQVVDVACGSGDAQTLCITDDDNVWSWGDGDYGKLGRGGSDGCKVPMKVDSLAGLGAVKVQLGRR
jgi:hypothetical protein